MRMIVNKVKHKKHYTVIANAIFYDTTLSCKAKGLFAQILSFASTWQFNIKGLTTCFKDSIGSIRSGLKELEERGYLIIIENTNKKGQFGESVYSFHEVPYNNDFWLLIHNRKSIGLGVNRILNNRCLGGKTVNH